MLGPFKTNWQTNLDCRPFFSCWNSPTIPGNSDTTECEVRENVFGCWGLKSFSRGNFQLEKKGLHLRFVCSLVLISLGFQPSQPSHPPVPKRLDNTLFRILKDYKQYKTARKDHLSLYGRVTGGLREGWWKILEGFFGGTCAYTFGTCTFCERSYGICYEKIYFR